VEIREVSCLADLKEKSEALVRRNSLIVGFEEEAIGNGG
jgi:hypothetical protein